MFAQYWADFQRSLWSPESWAKVLFILVTYPFWKPIVVAMWQELQVTLAPEGGIFARRKARAVVRRPPGLDPFVNVPLASRRRSAAARSRSRATSGDRAGRGRQGRTTRPPARAGFARTSSSRRAGFQN